MEFYLTDSTSNFFCQPGEFEGTPSSNKNFESGANSIKLIKNILNFHKKKENQKPKI